MTSIDDLRGKYPRLPSSCYASTVKMADKVYQSVEKMERNKQDVTKRTIAGTLEVDVKEIKTAVKHLVNSDYLRRTGGGSRSFMLVFDSNDNVEYCWTRDQIQKQLDETLEDIKKVSKKDWRRLTKLREEESTKLFTELFEVVEKHWEAGHTKIKNMAFRNTATRFGIS